MAHRQQEVMGLFWASPLERQVVFMLTCPEYFPVDEVRARDGLEIGFVFEFTGCTLGNLDRVLKKLQSDGFIVVYQYHIELCKSVGG